jgi:hypothetical protein
MQISAILKKQLQNVIIFVIKLNLPEEPSGFGV